MINLKKLIEEGAFSPLGPTDEVELIFESPVKIKDWVPNHLHNLGPNLAFTKKVKETCKCDGTFEEYEIYKNTIGKVKYDYFIEGDYIKVFFGYLEYNNGKTMVEETVWQDALHIGLCRKLIFDYYLKKYNAIVSDQNHSDLGENYWKRLVKDANFKGFKTFVLNTKTNEKIEINPNDMDQYWSENKTHFIYRFVIEKYDELG
jgi:hypothetical protein